MGPVLGDIIPLAIGVALSPLPIVAVILMLFSKNPRGTSLGFLAGWFLGVAVVASVVVFVVDPVQQATGGEDSPVAAVFRILLGVVLLVLAYRDWKMRPQPGEQADMPKWMQGIDSLTAGKALAMGVLLAGVNPKNLTLTVAAGVAIAAAGLSTSQAVVALVFYIVLACVTVAAPVVLALALGEKATPTLDHWKAWLTYNNAVVMMLLCLVFGIVLLSKGLGALIGP
jgi:threonine/homoserine/homoserine lactone efflux protein